MGIFKNGLLGGISGKVGNVVGVTRKGFQYFRSLPAKVHNPRTEDQVKQRSRFSLTIEFLKTITPFVRVGFQMSTEGRLTAFNAAMSYNMKNAFIMEAENVSLDFSKVLVSKGPLFVAPNINVEKSDNELIITWDATISANTNRIGKPKRSDQAMILAYNSVKKQSVYDLNAGKRHASAAIIELPIDWKSDKIEVFIAFKNAEGNVVSDSVYLGW